MSTYQPPGGQPPPEGTPSYAQPQDPWAGGFEQGLASVPTDPIPQQYDPYAQGLTPGDVWSQETVAGPYGYVQQQPPRSKVGVFILVFLIVLVLGGGGGVGAWYVIKMRDPNVNPSSSAGPSAPNPGTGDPVTSAPAVFDPYAVNVGDCLVNNATSARPDIQSAPCSPPKSCVPPSSPCFFKVIKISKGAAIKEGPDGKFDKDVTSLAECEGTDYESWYGYQDSDDDSLDLFFCMTNIP